MASIIYPATLPEVIAPGYEAQEQDGVIRSEMDAGPVKQRRRYTATSEYITCQTVCDEAELAGFRTFFKTTTAGGALRFSMAHPGTGVTREFRFREPPRTTYTDGLYTVSMSLEVLP